LCKNTIKTFCKLFFSCLSTPHFKDVDKKN
jgi:hypothetical protein